MKQNIGGLSEADLKARRRFWNKKGFFGEPTKRQLERSSMKMQKLVIALRIFFFSSSPEEVTKIHAKYRGSRLVDAVCMVQNASESDINHAISTFKIF